MPKSHSRKSCYPQVSTERVNKNKPQTRLELARIW